MQDLKKNGRLFTTHSFTKSSFGTLPKQRSSPKVPLETHFNVTEPGNDHNKSETEHFHELAI